MTVLTLVFGRQSGAHTGGSAADLTTGFGSTSFTSPSFLWPLVCCHGSEIDGGDGGASSYLFGRWSGRLLYQPQNLLLDSASLDQLVKPPEPGSRGLKCTHQLGAVCPCTVPTAPPRWCVFCKPEASPFASGRIMAATRFIAVVWNRTHKTSEVWVCLVNIMAGVGAGERVSNEVNRLYFQPQVNLPATSLCVHPEYMWADMSSPNSCLPG